LLNGVDVSAGLVVGGSETNRTVSYAGLAANVIYNGRIIVNDNQGRSSTNDFTFDTLGGSGIIVIEAENYNYGLDSNNDPVITDCRVNPGELVFISKGGGYQTAAPPSGLTNPADPGTQVNGNGNGYLYLAGVSGVDYSDTSNTVANPSINGYRTCDPVGVQNSTDFLRPQYAALNLPELQLHQMQAGEWLNYTRNFPPGNYRAYLRISSGSAQTVALSLVTSDASQPNQTSFLLGNFLAPNTAAAYTYVALTDVLSGDPMVLNLSGVQTLRLTALSANNNLRPNFLVLVPTGDSASLLGPIAQNLAPADMATLVRVTAKINAAIVNRLTSLDAGSIVLRLNGNNVTSGAVITPTANGATLLYQPPAPFQTSSVQTVRLEYRDTLANPFIEEWSFSVIGFVAADANLAYAAPPDNWYYTYTGDAAAGSPRRAVPIIPALDGTWTHENGSDEWNGDGRTAGDGAVGGVASVNGILTIEDAFTSGSGNNNNRKIYFIHDMAPDGMNQAGLLNAGVTLSFRTRLTPQSSELAVPDGYGIFNDGKGHFGISQANPGAALISFSLVRAQEEIDSAGALFDFGSAGLTMNRLNGDVVSGGGAVHSTAAAGTLNVLPLDPTVFHEFWITIQANDDTPGNGTHTVRIYVDGNTNAAVFDVTGGSGAEASGQSSLFLGSSNSGTTTAFDIDFFSYTPGVFLPKIRTAALVIVNPARTGNSFSLSFGTQNGLNYTVEYKTDLAQATWTFLEQLAGDGTGRTVTDSGAGGNQRFYRVRAQ